VVQVAESLVANAYRGLQAYMSSGADGLQYDTAWIASNSTDKLYLLSELASTPASGDDIDVRDPGGAIALSDFEGDAAACDIVIPVQEDGTFQRSAWLPSQYLTRVEWSFSVDDVASVSYTLDGEKDYDAVGNRKDIRVAEGTQTAANGFSITESTDLSSADVNFVGCTIRNVYYPNGQYAIANDGASAVTVGSLPVEIESGDRIRLVYYVSGSSTRDWATLQTHAGTILEGLAALKGGAVDIQLLASGGSASSVLRLQNATLGVDLGRTEQKELGSAEVIDRTPSYHLDDSLPVTITASAIESDLEVFARALGYSGTSDAGFTDNIWNTEQFKEDIQITVDVYDSEDLSSRTKLLVFTMANLTVNGQGKSIRIGDKATVEWSFAGRSFTITPQPTAAAPVRPTLSAP